jgi:asparagine synthase (glutamine-hydrolysing)
MVFEEHTFRTKSDSDDCSFVRRIGYDFCNKIDGDFAFVGGNGDDFVAARDPLE